MVNNELNLSEKFLIWCKLASGLNKIYYLIRKLYNIEKAEQNLIFNLKIVLSFSAHSPSFM